MPLLLQSDELCLPGEVPQAALGCPAFLQAGQELHSEPIALSALTAKKLRRRPPGILLDLQLPQPGCCAENSPDRTWDGMVFNTSRSTASREGVWRPRPLSLMTPSSCSSVSHRHILSHPGTPDPLRDELKTVVGNVGAVLFDFDGTLTASPGESAQRSHKKKELHERASLLRPRLQALRDAGLVLGIISKSSELTIRGALREADLIDFFDGPLLGKAVGLEGKAGFIEDLVEAGDLGQLGSEGVRRVLLVDDDIYELDRARARGIQTYAAPLEGGLQDRDFEEIFVGLGLSATSSAGALVPPGHFTWKCTVHGGNCAVASPAASQATLPAKASCERRR